MASIGKPIPGKCPSCKKETLEVVKDIISIKGMKYDVDVLQCKNCSYSTRAGK